MKKPPMRYLRLLTGPRGSGKTSWCASFVAHAREKDLNPGGLLSPALFHDGKKIGIDLLNIVTGEQRPLARRCAHSSQDIQLGDWCFDPTTLDWGNQILRTLKNRGLILLDELGPLEFEKGIGLIAGLKLIDEKMFHQAIVVIRPELLQPAKDRWPDAEVVDISCVETNLQILEKGIA
jgi:nucleoside-triphosphatase THEP1